LPTRVVVGFRVKAGATTEVHGADALAWPEVLFDRVGWVPFNPLPQPNTQPRPVEDDFKPQPEPSTPPPSSAPTPTPTPPSAKPSAPVTTADGGTSAGLVAAAATTGLFLVVALCLGTVVLLRRSRSRRRLYDGDPSGRIVGAWLEILDALRLAGRPPPHHLAATEVADHAARAARDHTVIRPAAPPLDDLAHLVNAVTFAPDGVGADQADRAVAQASAYVDDLRGRRSWWRRLLWTTDPRPLRWSRWSKRP
jgi:hypothetical protein